MKAITDDLITELEMLAKSASEGSWEWDDREVDDDGYVHIPECSYLVGSICLASHYENYQSDCDLIAASSPATILALLAERAELKRDAERYRWVISGEQEVETLVSIVRCHGGYEGKISERVDVYMQAAMQEQTP
ncbi:MULTISPECIES: hypothetical protein [Pseudomonas]|uniref:hypothetical protein n=1 Tax=Pseudomonas TaxID=286 RepID=UPI003001BFF0